MQLNFINLSYFYFNERDLYFYFVICMLSRKILCVTSFYKLYKFICKTGTFRVKTDDFFQDPHTWGTVC